MDKVRYYIDELGDVGPDIEYPINSPEFGALLADKERWLALFPELPENEPEEWYEQRVTDKLRDLLSFSPHAEVNYRRVEELADKYTGGKFAFAVSALRRACFELDDGASDEELLAAAEVALTGK